MSDDDTSVGPPLVDEDRITGPTVAIVRQEQDPATPSRYLWYLHLPGQGRVAESAGSFMSAELARAGFEQAEEVLKSDVFETVNDEVDSEWTATQPTVEFIQTDYNENEERAPFSWICGDASGPLVIPCDSYSTPLERPYVMERYRDLGHAAQHFREIQEALRRPRIAFVQDH